MKKFYTITLTQLLAEFQTHFVHTHLCPALIQRMRRDLYDEEVFIDDDETIFEKFFRICPDLFDEDSVTDLDSRDVFELAVREPKMFSNFHNMREFRMELLERMISMVGDATLTFRIDTVEVYRNEY